jgi:predicted phage-related endonuclease
MSKGKLTPDTMISASRLPGLLGFSKYSTQNDELMLSIKAMDGIDPEFNGNEAADWGNRLELQILNESAERLNLSSFNFDHTEAIFHPDWPLCTSLDGTADGRGKVVKTDIEAGIIVIGADEIVLNGLGCLEAKLTSQDAEEAPALFRGPIQLQGQMACTGANWGAVCTLYRGTKLRIFLFERHESTIFAIGKAVTDFQRRLDIYEKTKAIENYPPFDSADASKLFPSVQNEETLSLNLNSANLCRQILEKKKLIKELEEEIDFFETTLKEQMGTFGKATADNYSITWPMRSYKASPERLVPATEARKIRQSTITIKEAK